MKKTLIILLLVFLPGFTYASTAGDFIVNRQSTYAVPRDASNVLVLDLTLPEPKDDGALQLKSIKIHNAGTATHLDFAKLMIWEDGESAGWDGDERDVINLSQPPFFDTEISGNFREYAQGDSWRRIFIALDTSSDTYSLEEMSIKPELVVGSFVFSDSTFNGPTDVSIIGFERDIVYGAPIPTVPTTPLAGIPEVLSESTIRWHFTDLSDNEFGFKILDGNLKEVARIEQANLSYLDETGLSPDTEYSGRRVVAFNDRGESMGSTLTVFLTAKTLASPEITEVQPSAESEPQSAAEVEEPAELTLFETIQIKIADIQRQVNEFIKQLDELIKLSAATVLGTLQGFLQTFFGK